MRYVNCFMCFNRIWLSFQFNSMLDKEKKVFGFSGEVYLPGLA